MPCVFMIVAIVLVIPIAFVRLDHAGRSEGDQSQHETQFCDAQRIDHVISPTYEVVNLAQIICSETSQFLATFGCRILTIRAEYVNNLCIVNDLERLRNYP
jgi:hypothetical protein